MSLESRQVGDVEGGREVEVNRITSYNVCYTKLLRISQESPAASSVPGAVTQTQDKSDDPSALEAEAQQNTLEILKRNNFV